MLDNKGWLKLHCLLCNALAKHLVNGRSHITFVSNFANRSFSYVASRLYNKLPLSLKQIKSVDTFKKQLQSFFFSRAYDLSDHTVREEYAL